MNQLTVGNTPQARKKKYKDLDQRLLNVVSDYGNRSVLDYLLGISQNILFHD